MPVAVTQSQLTLTSSREAERLTNPKWWKRRSRLERTLSIITVVTLIMCAAMAVAIVLIGYRYYIEVNVKEICLDRGCIKAAATILNNMDTGVDPCEDFYQFACGGWIHSHEIPGDKASLSPFSQLQDAMDLQLKRLVEQPVSQEDPTFIVSSKNMYASCMNTTKIDELGSTPLLDMLQRIGEWPLLPGNKWDESSFDWIATTRKLRELGYRHDCLFDVYVSPDLRNNTRHIIGIDQPGLAMPDRSYLLKGPNDTTVKAYYTLMVESVVFLGVNRTTAEEEMMDVLQFEMKIAQYSVPKEERRNISQLYNKMNAEDLKDLAQDVDWLELLNAIMVNNVTKYETVIAVVPSYIRSIGEELKTTNGTTIANYIMWRIIFQSLPMLHRPWGLISQQYYSVITGKEEHSPRWEQCLASVMGTLGLAIASLYVRNHFREDSKAAALEMVNFIHKEFLKTLEHIDWMDETTKVLAKEKAKLIKPFIGYPDEILNDKILSDFYKEIDLSPATYFENALKLRKWSVDYVFGKLREPNVKGDWKKHAAVAVVNAYYSPLENSIEFPAGILQGLFFTKDRPTSMNFGGIGFVIGHEITHGFDDTGRQFDKDGNNVNWWEPETDERFRERAQCIVEQYGNLTVPEIGMQINGINTQGENIADNGGLKLAYKAYQEWKKENGADATLPGLSFTSDQLFWISSASVWCGKYRPEELKLRVLSGQHSPPRYRVVVTLSNMPEFSKDFQCPKGSLMNPENKCSLW